METYRQGHFDPRPVPIRPPHDPLSKIKDAMKRVDSEVQSAVQVAYVKYQQSGALLDYISDLQKIQNITTKE